MASTSADAPAAKKQEWTPRMWQGCSFSAWVRLLARNRCAIEPRYWYIGAIDTVTSAANSLGRLLQEALYGRAIRRTALHGPPIFVLGHWRTGTTLLHDLLICDERFGYPTTYQCLGPCHFLLSEGFMAHWERFLVPQHRPMDNVKMGFGRPQEDEFALALLTGDASPYLQWAFPNHRGLYDATLDMHDVPEPLLRRWKRTFKQFLKTVSYRCGKRLVLKSPPHTARVPLLNEMFPGALYVHIMRDPYVVFRSTVNLWRTLYAMHCLQTPDNEGIEEHVYTTYLRLYERLEEGKKLLAPGQFFELRYEDLVRDPAGELRRLYDALNLDGFDRFLPRLEAYLATIKGYETNRWTLTPEQRAEITRRWGDVIRRYGYPVQDG